MTNNSKAALASLCAAAVSALALLAACGSSDDPRQPDSPALADPAPTAMPMASGGVGAAERPATPMPAEPAPPAPTAVPAPPTPTPAPAPSWPALTATPVPTATPFPQPPEPGDGGMGGDGGFQPPPPVMTMLADGVYHYFSSFYSNLIVIGEDEVLVTDTANAARGEELKAAVAELTDAPITTIVLTHEHYDHVGGTGVFPDAKVVCHRNCEAIFDLHPSRTDPDTAIAALGDVPDQVDETFDVYKEIQVGETTVELHYMGPGDGDAMIVIWLPQEKILVTSDMYEPRALSGADVVDDKNFVGVRHILNTVSEWDIAHAVNAHSQGTDPTDLRENVEYYNDLFDAVKTEVDAAIAAANGAAFGAYSLFDTLPQTLELEKYQDWGNYDAAFPKHVERMLLGIYHGD